MTPSSSFFSPFSGKFPLSKTLRFALSPQGATLAKMQEQGILQRDEQRENDYKTIKPLFDALHEKFIKQSLEKSQIDWSDFFIFYQAYKPKIRKDSAFSEKEKTDVKTEFSSRLASLRKEVVALYGNTASQRQAHYPVLKEKGYKILTESAILEVLEKEWENDEEKQKVIKDFKGFFTYFSGFNQNRENYYSAEEKSTAVAHRIVDENLIFFCENALLKDKLAVLELSEAEKKIFEMSFYNQCLTQDGINTYNQLIG
jgi:CRISPR-associated protein Cpf1